MPKAIKITIETENSAFDDEEYEVKRILRQLLNAFPTPNTMRRTCSSLYDINGNKVGLVEIKQFDKAEELAKDIIPYPRNNIKTYRGNKTITGLADAIRNCI